MAKNNQVIEVLKESVRVQRIRQEDYISLTDIAKHKNPDDPRFIIQNWMRTHFTIEFLGIWEQLNNPDFNRVEFEAVKNEAGSNAFVMTPTKWHKLTHAIGIISKAGRYGGTYAHKQQNPDKDGNIRDYANVSQLVCLANLESINALLIDDVVKRLEVGGE